MTNEEFLFEVRLHKAISESKLKGYKKLLSEGRNVDKKIVQELYSDVAVCRLVEAITASDKVGDDILKSVNQMKNFFKKLNPSDLGVDVNTFLAKPGLFQKISSGLKGLFSKSKSWAPDATKEFYRLYPFYFDMLMAKQKLPDDVFGQDEVTQMKAVAKLPISQGAKNYLSKLAQAKKLDDVQNLLDQEYGSTTLPDSLRAVLPKAGQMTAGQSIGKFFSLFGDMGQAIKNTSVAAAKGVVAVAGAVPGVAKGAADAIKGGAKALAGGLKGPAAGAEGEATTPAEGEPGGSEAPAGGLAAAAAGAAGEAEASGGGGAGTVAAGITDATPDEDVKAIVAALVKAKGAPAVQKLLQAAVGETSPFAKAIDESTSFGRLIEMSVRTR